MFSGQIERDLAESLIWTTESTLLDCWEFTERQQTAFRHRNWLPKLRFYREITPRKITHKT
jgi:hypothetical protein